MEQEPNPKKQLAKDQGYNSLLNMPSKLSKRVLGKDKKLRGKIERTELRQRANQRFTQYMESISAQQTG